MWNDRGSASRWLALGSRLGAALTDGVCVKSLCQARPDPNWTRLDDPRAAPLLPAPDRVRIIVPFVDVITGQQVPNIEVLACERLDADCQMPGVSSISKEKARPTCACLAASTAT